MQERSLCEHCRLIQVLLQTRLCGHTQAKCMHASQNSVTSACRSVHQPVYPCLCSTHKYPAHTVRTLLSHSANTGLCVRSEPKNMCFHQEPHHSDGSYETYKTYRCLLLFHSPFHIFKSNQYRQGTCLFICSTFFVIIGF